MNAIEARQLTRNFGKTRAVDSVSLDVPQGTVLGLLGPNGAGKSTLLKLLVGHLRPTSGSAAILGQPIAQRDPARWLRIGYVSQARYLPAWMTASECLRFARAFRPQWDEPKARRLIERLELPVDTRIRNLSRGHYVRLQIVLALAHNPELILLDEPTSGIDPVGRHELLALLIEEMAPEAARTVVFSSHLVEDIERMADAVAILDAGRIVASGSIDTIKGSRSRVEFSSSVPEAELSAVPGLISVKRGSGRTVAITSEPDNAVRYLQSRGAADAAVASASLEQVFFDYVNNRREE
jgi:ABC-2 type transport system ATP-binding protein